MRKYLFMVSALLACLLMSGCEVLLIGTAATVGYKLSTDQKTVGEAFDDSVITGSIKTRLIEDPDIRALNIDVDTELGEVSLSGHVRSRAEAEKAATIAKGVKGVKNVTSLLKVRVMK